MIKTKDVIRMTLLVSVVLMATFLMLRLMPAVRFLLFLLLFVAAPLIVLLLVWDGIGKLRARKAAKDLEKTTIGQLQKQASVCESQIEKLRAEREDIQGSIKELKTKLAIASPLTEGIEERTRQLLQAFEQEDDLRLTKIQFYEKCLDKLKSIREQFEWLQALEEKQAQLEKYQEQHYDQVAEMEEMRWDIEKERVHLETVQNLTTRMQQLTAVRDALHLQKELDQLLADG